MNPLGSFPFSGFNAYDLLAYLASGIVAFAAIDIAFGTQLVIGANWSIGGGVFLLVAAYAIGQVLAAPSEWLLGNLLVAHCLGRPTQNLVEGPRCGYHKALAATVLPEYYTPLAAETLQRVRRKAGKLSGEELFWKLFRVAKKDMLAYSRMEIFLRLYGFCRNLAFVALLAAIVFIIAVLAGHRTNLAAAYMFLPANPWWKIVVFLVIGLGMTHRYLKFLRLYALEVFVAYAEAGPGTDKAAEK